MATKLLTAPAPGTLDPEVPSEIVFTVQLDPVTGEPAASDATAVGSPADLAWNGTDPSASLISIMKACYAKLTQIETNTGA